jgi:hypothetical protein
MIALLAKIAFGLAVAVYALHIVTASLDEVTTPFDPTPTQEVTR